MVYLYEIRAPMTDSFSVLPPIIMSLKESFHGVEQSERKCPSLVTLLYFRCNGAGSGGKAAILFVVITTAVSMMLTS